MNKTGKRIFCLVLLAFLITATLTLLFPILITQASDTEIDSYASTNRDDHLTLTRLHPENAEWRYSALGQSFTTLNDGTNYKITSVKFMMMLQGSPTGTAYIKLYAHSGTYGTSSVCTGSALGTSEGLDISTISNSVFTLYELTFTDVEQYEMLPNTKYCIEFGFISSGTINDSNYILIGMDGTSPAHGGNTVGYSNGMWRAVETTDTIFYVYGLSSADTTAPTFGTITTNTTIAGEPVRISCTISDETAVDFWGAAHNNTGSTTNITKIDVDGSPISAYFDLTWDATVGNKVWVQFWANDTLNNEAYSTVQTFILLLSYDWNWMGGDYTGYYNVTAVDGTPTAIQAAINDVVDNGTYPSAGCGNVFIPNGNFSWNGEVVTLPTGVNVFGVSPAGCKGHEDNWEAYFPLTILHNTAQPTSGYRPPNMFYVDGSNDKQTRIAGIHFEATPPLTSAAETLSGTADYAFINIQHGAKNIRVDHCGFINNCYMAIQFSSYESTYPVEGGYGLFDHCIVDLPYKDNYEQPWFGGYGFNSMGNMKQDRGSNATIGNWLEDGTVFAGKYESINDTTLMYVEDCHFSRCRHALDGDTGGAIYGRYCLFDNPTNVDGVYATYGEIAAHGTSTTTGVCSVEMVEVYNCTFINNRVDDFQDLGFSIRGGHCLIYNNTFVAPDLGWQFKQFFVGIYDEGGQPDAFGVDQSYIWNNTGHWSNDFPPIGTNVQLSPPYTYTILVDNTHDPNVVFDVDLFVRAPTQSQDGWTYTPYPYPHYLTLEDGEPPIYYTLTVSIGAGDGTTNPTEGEHVYLEGTTVWVYAYPAGGAEFINFTLDSNPTPIVDNPKDIDMTEDHTLTVYFTESSDTYTLSVSWTTPTTGTKTSPTVPFSVSTLGNETGVTYQIQLFNETIEVYPSNFTSATGSFTGLANGTYVAGVYVEGDHGEWDYEEVQFSVEIITTDWYAFTSISFKDLANGAVSTVTWKLYNASDLLTYTIGQYTLVSGTYTLKTYLANQLINSTDFDTDTYGNSSLTVYLQLVQSSTYSIAIDGAVDSLEITSENATHLLFSATGTGSFTIVIPSARNATYVSKDGVNQTYGEIWTFDLVNQAIIITTDSLSDWEIEFAEAPEPESPLPPSYTTTVTNFFTFLYLAISLMCFLPLVIIGVFFFKGGYQNPRETSQIMIAMIFLAVIWLILMLMVASIQAVMT